MRKRERERGREGRRGKKEKKKEGKEGRKNRRKTRHIISKVLKIKNKKILKEDRRNTLPTEEQR